MTVKELKEALSKTIEEIYVAIRLIIPKFRGSEKSILVEVCKNLDNINRSLGA